MNSKARRIITELLHERIDFVSNIKSDVEIDLQSTELKQYHSEYSEELNELNKKLNDYNFALNQVAPHPNPTDNSLKKIE